MVLVVFSAFAYMFGLHMLFMHNAFEVFYYALYFGLGISLYQVVASVWNFFFEAESKPSTT